MGANSFFLEQTSFRKEQIVSVWDLFYIAFDKWQFILIVIYR